MLTKFWLGKPGEKTTSGRVGSGGRIRLKYSTRKEM
jgi:hypothetical protein